jgi:hypothetical protein
MTTLTVPARYNGPATSGNGGWTAGALSVHVAGSSPGSPVTVRLVSPPPLDTPMDVVPEADGVLLRHGSRDVAMAAPGAAVATVRPLGDRQSVPLDEAVLASAGYRGFDRHPFPGCFSCGPERAEGDGLRIFPGRLDDNRVAAPWHAHDVDVPTVWAALDCVGGWTSDMDRRPMVLGQMTAEVLRLPQAGARYVVVGTAIGVEGRKTRTRSELYDVEGDLLAHADHVWIEVDPDVFNALG